VPSAKRFLTVLPAFGGVFENGLGKVWPSLLGCYLKPHNGVHIKRPPAWVAGAECMAGLGKLAGALQARQAVNALADVFR
jgi:hypothetical protein